MSNGERFEPGEVGVAGPTPCLVKAGKSPLRERASEAPSTACARGGAPGVCLGVLSLLLVAAFAMPSEAAKSTYRRRFFNKTSVVIVWYRLTASGWAEPVVGWPGIPVDREAPKGGPPEVFGADLGMDGRIELARSDFGTVDWKWVISENIPR